MALHISRPQPGFYERRLVKAGPRVAVAIYRPCPIDMPDDKPWTYHGHRDRVAPYLEALVDGHLYRYGNGQIGDPVEMWNTLRPITYAEYMHRLHVKNWAQRHASHLPEANPRAPIDIGSMPSLF